MRLFLPYCIDFAWESFILQESWRAHLRPFCFWEILVSCTYRSNFVYHFWVLAYSLSRGQWKTVLLLKWMIPSVKPHGAILPLQHPSPVYILSCLGVNQCLVVLLFLDLWWLDCSSHGLTSRLGYQVTNPRTGRWYETLHTRAFCINVVKLP